MEDNKKVKKVFFALGVCTGIIIGFKFGSESVETGIIKYLQKNGGNAEFIMKDMYTRKRFHLNANLIS